MSREREKIHIQILHIHRDMRNTLCAVAYKDRTVFMCNARKCLYIILHAHNIGNLCHGDKFCVFCQCRTEHFLSDQSRHIDFQIMQFCADGFRRLHPRKQVAVVLHDCNQNSIPFLQECTRPAVSHKIQTLGRISGKHDLFCRSCVNKCARQFTCVLVYFRCADRKIIKPPQRICIRFFIVITDCIQNHLRLLRRSGIIQICDFRVIVNQRKISADLIVHGFSVCHVLYFSRFLPAD